MNFKSFLNKIGCDDRIRGGYVELNNPEHVFVLQEYLINEGYNFDEVVNKTAKLFEAGRFPERQAYNKDGILVTFPTKEYRDRAVDKGTHFAENPKKSQSNIFADELPSDIQRKLDQSKEGESVTLDSELEKDIEGDSNSYEDRTPKEKKIDAVAVDAILSNETPLVNYSVDEAKRYGFYNKGFLWYDSNGDFIGEQFFDEGLGRSIITNEKKSKSSDQEESEPEAVEPKPEEEPVEPKPVELEPEEEPVVSKSKMDIDMDVLRKLGMGSNISEKDIQKYIDDVNLSTVTLSPGPNNKYLFTPVNISGLENILRKEETKNNNKTEKKSEEKTLTITYAGSVKKLRTKYNVRIVEWGDSKKIGDKNFYRILVIYIFYKKYSDKISLVSRQARGLGYEKMQVDNINEWFVENEIKIPLHLYIADDSGQFRDCEVNVNGANKLAGSGKADLALNANQIDNFWISYKHGDYWDENGVSLSSVPFQQYGSIKTLNRRLKDDEKWKEIINSFVNSMKSIVDDKIIIPKDQYISTTEKGNGEKKLVIKNVSDGKVDEEKTNILNINSTRELLLKSNSATLDKIFLNQANVNLNKTIYFCPSGYNVWMDLLDGSLEAKQIAGMSIYGLNFKFGSVEYGPENVQCLIQTGEKLSVGFYGEEETLGIKMKTDSKGHILFNPNLPAPKDSDDPILIYRPVVNGRYTEVENFVSTERNNINIFLGCRILIMPYGKIPGTSIKL